MNLQELDRCPGTLAAGFSTYSPGCLRNLFHGKKVSHILPYDPPQQNEEVEVLFLENRKVDRRNPLADSIINQKWKAFDEYVVACKNTEPRVYLFYVSDRDIAALKHAEEHEDESVFKRELDRVRSLNQKEFSDLEDFDSFVSYLRTIDPVRHDYFDKVYNRLDLEIIRPQLPQSDGKGCAALLAVAFVVLGAILISSIV